MTFLPQKCFTLIKEFAWMHPARYHHKKIAVIIETLLQSLKDAWRYGEVVPHIPLVYKINYLEEACLDWHAGRIISTGGRDYHEIRKALDEVRFKLDVRLYLIAWNKVYRHLTQNHVWLKITTKIELATSRRLINNGWLIRTYCNTATRDSCEKIYVPELKQFCKENNIPKQQYSSLTRTGLISLIQNYNFDES